MANRSNHAKYAEDSQYKNGIGFFRREGSKLKETVRYCERCGKDLKNAGRYSWVEEAKPLILARRKCNDYPERE